jgi:hypothetical protein
VKHSATFVTKVEIARFSLILYLMPVFYSDFPNSSVLNEHIEVEHSIVDSSASPVVAAVAVTEVTPPADERSGVSIKDLSVDDDGAGLTAAAAAGTFTCLECTVALARNGKKKDHQFDGKARPASTKLDRPT